MPNRRLVKDPERYKTVLCAGWSSTGACSYGRKCQFAHGREELRVRTAPPLADLAMQQNPALAAMYGLQPQLPHAPMPMWPPQPNVVRPGMPPLPPGPPPQLSGAFNHQQLASAPGVAPPIPVSGPLPGSVPQSDYQAALLAQAAALQTAALHAAAAQQHQQMAATRHQQQQQGFQPPQPQMPVQLGQCAPCGPPLGGPLECQPALIAPTPNTTPPQLPAAILPGSMPTPAPLPAPHPGQQQPLRLPAAMAPAAEPPLPIPSLTPSLPAAMAPAAEPVTPMTSTTGAATTTSNRPSNISLATPPELDKIWGMSTPDLGSFDLMKSALPPKDTTIAASGGGSGGSGKDQMMATTLGKENCFDGAAFSSIGELWSPLKADGSQSKSLWPDSGGLRVERLSENSGDKLDKLTLDSPLEPGLNKRDTSFQPKMVGRMAAFIFDDPASPLHSNENSRHGGTKSPHTAIAA